MWAAAYGSPGPYRAHRYVANVEEFRIVLRPIGRKVAAHNQMPDSSPKRRCLTVPYYFLFVSASPPFALSFLCLLRGLCPRYCLCRLCLRDLCPSISIPTNVSIFPVDPLVGLSTAPDRYGFVLLAESGFKDSEPAFVALFWHL